MPINAVSRKDAFTVLDIQDALDGSRGARYFTTFDLLSGYRQLGMTECAMECSAVCIRHGLFQFTRMSFGLHRAPATFCRLMSLDFSDLLWNICLCYLDDIIVYARTQADFIKRLHIVLSRLRDVGLKVKPFKCEFFRTHVQFLGNLASNKGINLFGEGQGDTWMAKAAMSARYACFLRPSSYYRKFVKGFVSIAEPHGRTFMASCLCINSAEYFLTYTFEKMTCSYLSCAWSNCSTHKCNLLQEAQQSHPTPHGQLTNLMSCSQSRYLSIAKVSWRYI